MLLPGTKKIFPSPPLAVAVLYFCIVGGPVLGRIRSKNQVLGAHVDGALGVAAMAARILRAENQER